MWPSSDSPEIRLNSFSGTYSKSAARFCVTHFGTWLHMCVRPASKAVPWRLPRLPELISFVNVCSSASRCNVLGQFMLSDDCVEFLAQLKCCENRQRFAVSCYRSSQTVERRGVFRCFASCYLGVRRQFEYSFYGFVLHDPCWTFSWTGPPS